MARYRIETVTIHYDEGRMAQCWEFQSDDLAEVLRVWNSYSSGVNDAPEGYDIDTADLEAIPTSGFGIPFGNQRADKATFCRIVDMELADYDAQLGIYEVRRDG